MKRSAIMNKPYLSSFGCLANISIIVLFVSLPSSLADIKKPEMATSSKGMIVTCEPLAAKVGLEILKNGGNAADAFIATTLAEYVTAFGYTSLSGPLYLLYFDSKTKSSIYLNAGLNQTKVGSSYVVAGAARGLDELNKRFGSKKFAFNDLVTPAMKLAQEGFPLTTSFARAIQSRAPLFSKSKEWLDIYTRNKIPLNAGERLVQPKLADTLMSYGRIGADYFYQGAFAKHLVNTIQANGGNLTIEDLSRYQTNWNKPLQTQYRDFTVLTGSYRSYGGLELLLGLKVVENNKTIGIEPRFYEDLSGFEKVLRTYLFSYEKLMPEISHFHEFERNFPTIESKEAFLKGSVPANLWKKVTDSKQPAPWIKDGGHHSCNPVVIDRDGNIATGLHTINSAPWGDGLMVDGVSLNAARPVAMDAPPGERALDGVAPVLVFKNSKPWAAAGFFAGSLQPAALQVLINLMDYGLPPNEAVFAPRFGHVLDYRSLRMGLDSRIPATWVQTFSEKGIHFDQPKDSSSYIDTGDAMVIRIDSMTGLRSGSPTEKLSFPVAIGE